MIKKLNGKFLFIFSIIFVVVSTSVAEDLKERYSAKKITEAEQLDSFVSHGVIKIGETIGTISTFYSKPGRSRSTLTLNEFQITQVFDGKKAWMRDQNGHVLELTGADKKELVNTGWLMSKSYLLENGMPGEVEYLTDTIIESKNYSLYNALPDGGDSLKLYFNPETGRIEIIGESLDGTGIFTFLSDFKEVDGFEMAFKYDAKSAIPELNSTIEITNFEVNEPFDDSLFRFAASVPDDYYFPENADSIIVPIVYQAGHIFFKAAVDGNRKVYFILDSGAGINFINRSYADSLNHNLSGGIPAKGMSGYENTTIAGLDSMQIGNLTLYNQNAAIIDLADVGLVAPDGILGGLLGYDFLSRFQVRIDYLKQNLIIYSPSVSVEMAVDYEINIEYNMKVPIVDAEICGVTGRFLIDLGNSFGLILHKPFVDNNNLSSRFTDINTIGKDISGVGGTSETYSAIAEYVALGPARLNELRVLVAEGEQGILKSTDVDGNIGNGLLQNFSIILDYPHQKIYIMPLEN